MFAALPHRNPDQAEPLVAEDNREPEDARVYRWLLEQFQALSFPIDAADLLAASHADYREAKQLLDAGCSQSLVIRILT